MSSNFVSGLAGPPARKRTLADSIVGAKRAIAEKQNKMLAKMRAKEVRDQTRELREKSFQDELADAEEWYKHRRLQDAYKAARQRQDHLLPEDEQALPF